MICIIPDTNILLNTIKGDYDELYFLSALQALTINKKVVLAIPEQVKIEWDRHVQDVLEGARVTLKNDISKAKKLKLFLLPQTAERFMETIEKVDSEIDKMVQFRILRKVTALNELIDKHSIIIPTKPDYKLIAADWALDKFAPFFGSKDKQSNAAKDDKRKNSMADAIIFQSAVDHFTTNTYTKGYFLTENYTDFSKAGDKKQIHENLLPLIPGNLSYEIHVEKFYYEITKSTGFKNYTYEESIAMEKLIEEAEKRRESNIPYPDNTLDCPRCGQTLDDRNDGGWHNSMYGGGLSWWRNCPNCGLQWDTGEYYD